MAEVRKKVIEDKYNTANIKKSTKKKDEKSVKKQSTKKKENKTEKKSLLTKFRIFCNGVKSEFNKVHWPTKDKMIKYSIAVIVFVIFCAIFFYIIDVLFALFQSLF